MLLFSKKQLSHFAAPNQICGYLRRMHLSVGSASSNLFVCLKTYPIVFDLHFQVTVSKYKTGMNLNEYDVQMRLDELSTVSTDVESWSDTTLASSKDTIALTYLPACESLRCFLLTLCSCDPPNTMRCFGHFFPTFDHFS